MSAHNPPVTVVLDFNSLKEKQRALRSGFSDSLSLRVHRAISWFGRAEAESDDLDVRFILLWIGFNAAYASDIDAESDERGAFKAYFDTLVALDRTHRIYDAVWARFSQEIRLLLANKYVFAPFWHHRSQATAIGKSISPPTSGTSQRRCGSSIPAASSRSSSIGFMSCGTSSSMAVRPGTARSIADKCGTERPYWDGCSLCSSTS
jgi:hypothetical protein